MDIKIKCTAVEFASLARKCSNIELMKACGGCVMQELCSERGCMARIEHIVDVELVKDGAADG